jgi:tight adherence protein B
MKNLIIIVLAVAAVAFAEAVYYVVRYLSERQADELKRRLSALGDASAPAGMHILRRRRLAASQSLNELLSGIRLVERLEKLIEQSDMDLSVAQLLAYMGALALVGFVAALILRRIGLALPFMFVGGILPVFAVVREKNKRAKLISEQLPDALEMMSRAIKAGHALPSSFKLVAQECSAPVAVEFAKAYEQQNLGLSFEDAVLQMTERVPDNLDLKLFAVSVVIQKETGGNLVELLENISNTMRERFKFYSKLSALTAEGRLSGVILGALPFVVAFMIFLSNPDYLMELGHGFGHKILLFGLASWTVGVLWIRSMLKVEY